MIQIQELASPAAPVLLVGAPGVGKTACVQQAFDYTCVMLTSAMVEEDIAGIPYRDGKFDRRTVPATFEDLACAAEKGQTTCLFLDELDKARRAVADTLLTLVQSRRSGGAILPESTCIVAAANPPEFGGGDGISDAMLNRFCVVEWLPEPSVWAAWARQTFGEDPRADAVITGVECGEIALIDQCGEGLQRRMTTPRTLTMALHKISESPNQECFAQFCRGLLTADVASRVVDAVYRIADRATLQECTNVVRAVRTKGHQPLTL
jgi:hypothetical protein